MAFVTISGLGASPKLPPEPTAILPAEPVWTKLLEAPPSANGAMDDAHVYIPIEGGGLHAFRRDTGELVWTEPADMRWPPIAAGGSVLTALPDEIRAHDPDSGAQRWSFRHGAAMSAPLAWAGGLVIVALDTGDIVALDGATGTAAWRQSLGAAATHVPAVVGDTAVAVSLADSRVVALAVKTGEQLWERRFEGTLSAPAAARDRVFVGSTNNFFYALDAESGDERWRWRTGGDVVGAAADGDRVYFASLDNVLRAVNRGNGNQIWKAAIPTRPSSPPRAFGDVVVLTGVTPRVDAFLGKTGVGIGTFTAPAELQGVPMIDTSPQPFEVAMVALTRDGRMVALRPVKLMFPDPPLTPLLKLPGRELPRELRPGAGRLP